MKNGRKNGHRNGKVRVAIVGAGNCASSFVQGVQYYRDASPKLPLDKRHDELPQVYASRLM